MQASESQPTKGSALPRNRLYCLLLVGALFLWSLWAMYNVNPSTVKFYQNKVQQLQAFANYTRIARNNDTIKDGNNSHGGELISPIIKWAPKNNTNRTVLFVHLSKCGGSSVCHIMTSRMPMTDPAGRKDFHRTNCEVQFRMPNGKWDWTNPRTCRDLDAFSTDGGVGGRLLHMRRNFLAVSYPYHDEMPCPGFRSFSVVRHPVGRYLSLINYFGKSFTEAFVADHIRSMRGGGAYNPNHVIAIHPTNSWTIRQLLGHERYFDPRPVDEADYLRALTLVGRFDAFLPLEYLHHPNVMRAAKVAVPEYHAGLASGNTTTNKSANRFNFSKEFVELLTEENKYDILLYEHVLKTFDLK